MTYYGLRTSVSKSRWRPILSYLKDTPNTVTLTLGDMNWLDEGQFLNDSLTPPPW